MTAASKEVFVALGEVLVFWLFLFDELVLQAFFAAVVDVLFVSRDRSIGVF